MQKILNFSRANIFSLSRNIACRLFKFNHRKKILSVSLGFLFANYLDSSYSFFTDHKKPLFVSSAESCGITIFSKENQEPLSSGFVLSKDGKFVTILNVFKIDESEDKKIKSDSYYAKTWDGIHSFPIVIDYILSEENLVFGHLDLSSQKNHQISANNLLDFSNKDVQVIGEKVFLFSKSVNKLNIIEKGFIIDHGNDGIDMLVNFRTQDHVCFGSPIMSKEGKIVGILQPTISDQYENNLLMTGGNSFREICNQFIQNGQIKKNYLGLSVKFTNSQLTVIKINSGGPANLSGIKLGDVIQEINGKKIENINDFMRRVGYNKNSKINLKILRNGKLIDYEINSE